MENNYKKVKQVLWLILFANLGVALLKILVGMTIKSSSLISDGFHSVADGMSNCVGIVGMTLASKDKDKEHPYGHYKLEIISSIVVGGMLLFVGCNIALSAITSFSNPVVPAVTIESIIALIITLIINIFVSRYEYSIGKKLDSFILVSDSLHTKSDIFVSIGVLATLVGLKLGLPPIIDTLVSLIVAWFILKAAYEVLKPAVDILVDTAVIDENEIIELLNEFEEIKAYHNIRSRGSESNIHVDMHVMVEADMSVERSHELSHNIEDRLREITNENTQVIVHIEPYYEKSNS